MYVHIYMYIYLGVHYTYITASYHSGHTVSESNDPWTMYQVFAVYWLKIFREKNFPI